MNKSSASVFFLVLILCMGFALRLAGINYGVPSKNKALTTYHPDEPLSFYTIEKWRPAQFNFHPGRAILWGGFHLFPMAASLKFAQIIGYLHFGSRDFYVNNLLEADKLYKVTRFLQILCGTVSIGIIFLLVQNTFGTLTALLSAFFLCFSAVHIVNSFNNRPDPMMILFSLISLFYGMKVFEKPEKKYSIVSGIFLGLATATKYSAAPYGIFHLLIHLLSPARENRKNLLLCLSAALLFFLLGCPYLILDFPWFRQQFMLNVGLVKGSIVPVVSGPGWKTYATYFLPYGLGWVLSYAGLLGWFWMTAKIIYGFVTNSQMKLKERFYMVWVAGSWIVYMVISAPKSQQVWYVFPVIPFFVIFAAFLCGDLIRSSKNYVRISGILLTFVICFHSAVYSIAYLKLFVGKNVREEASEWIEKNIPAGESIGISRSYFWTPGILRQYYPPYQLLQGGDDQSVPSDAILGLGKVSEKANYLVLTEFEYRTYLSPLFSGVFPRQTEILKSVMNDKYREIIRFDQEATFLGFHFPKKDFPPFDWIMPNPTIKIFKKIPLPPSK